ncbi:peptide ABC transporter substrate-binding protein [Vagococcus salmoninarum]|uniref:peptide ABC transporter substrate-binding protein n=1 Tax=Vagococcus salmoninarum TaxID=2739 RepID=UPI00187FAA51|nr:peptide ABC transporter substrate-binding protein [Vagococcus salmoninarum]MBE9388480.1 peptide ABC transporter substrate-binding protein [Vagococcus salmoninarum]
MNKKPLVSILFLGLLMSLTACSTKDNKIEAGSVREVGISLDAELSTGDPALSQDSVSNEMLNQVMEGLLRLDNQGELSPAMATALPEVSSDGLTYTFKLNKEALWSDGSQVTADDFVFAWQRVADPVTASNYANLMYYVKNGEAINLENADPKSLGVKAIDAETLEVTLAEPTTYFLSLLTSSTFFPLKEAYLKEQGTDFAMTSDSMLYNGPFTLTGWDGTNSQWVYQKNPDYWDAESVNIDIINNQVIKEIHTGFNLYQNDELAKINLTGEYAQQNASNPDLVSELDARSTYLEIDHVNHPALKNKKLRQAIALSLSNEEIADNIIQDGSKALHGLIPTGLMSNPTSNVDFREDTGDYLAPDLAKAQSLWEEAQKELTLTELDLEILIDDDDTTKKVAEAMQASLETNLPSLKLTLKRVPKKLRVELGDKGEFDLLLSGWGADKLDGTAFLDLFTTDSSFNSGSFSNLEYDALLEKIHTTWTNDPQARYEAMVAAEKILLDDVGIVPLYQKSQTSLIKPYLKGLVNYPVGAVNYKYVTLEEK